jgi:large subunit ribosomal protein L21
MYAIIETGGKQYRVAEGDVIKVEKLNNIVDNSVTFNKVMMVADGDNISVGNPFIESAKVTADVLETAKAKKVLVFKQKVRKGHRKLRGHRQYYTAVRIKSIQVN